MSISSASELELVLLDQAPLQLGKEGITKEKMARRVGVGDYSREARDLSRDGYYSRTVLFRSHG